MSQTQQQSDPKGQAALPSEVTELLLELSSGVHRHAMYPPGHPSLDNVAEGVHARLRKALYRRDALIVGIAHDQLVVEGATTDPKHPLISDLARRLHDHQLGALSFDRGVTLPQVEALLERLSQDVEQGFEPIGLLERSELPNWAHVRLFPVGYDHLQIREGESDSAGADGAQGSDVATELWLQLAQSALATEEVGVADADPLRLARSIEGQGSEVEEKIVGHLLQLTEVLQHRPRSEADAIRDQVSQLIQALDEGTLERLMEMGGDFDRRRKFLLDASQGLAVDSVVKILESAATASEQTISTLLIRLLKKLAWHAEEDTGAARDEAETALKENVEELIEDWNLEDPNPDEYSLVLDSMAEGAPALAGESRGRETSGALRVVQMALELDAWGATVQIALDDLLARREVSALLQLVEATSPDNGVAQRIEEILTDARRFHQLVTEDALDSETLQRLVTRIGDSTVEPLLLVLAESESREVRRKIFDELTRMGPAVGPAVVRHLEDERWFVARNMLALVQRMDVWPAGFDPLPFLTHADPRVRREAFPLAISRDSSRNRGFLRAMADTDERLVQMALRSARPHMPPVLVPSVINRVILTDRRSALRTLAIEAMVGVPLPMARDALVDVCLDRTGLLGRKALAARSPELIAALKVLSGSWAGDSKARRVLDMAGRSNDPEIRRAAGGDDTR